MKVTIINAVLPGDPPTHLNLEPSDDRDRKTCEALVSGGHTCGFGRDRRGKIIHVQVPLVSVLSQ